MAERLHLCSALLTAILGVLSILPHSLLGNPAAEEDDTGRSALLRRVKRGWVWNQFFVLEEYTGLEPLYIGKVSPDHAHVHVLACGPQRWWLFFTTFWLTNGRAAATLRLQLAAGFRGARPARSKATREENFKPKRKEEHNLILEWPLTASLLSTWKRSQTAAVQLIDSILRSVCPVPTSRRRCSDCPVSKVTPTFDRQLWGVGGSQQTPNTEGSEAGFQKVPKVLAVVFAFRSGAIASAGGRGVRNQSWEPQQPPPFASLHYSLAAV